MTTQLELEQKPFIELQIEALVEENCIKRKRVNKFIDDFEDLIVSIKKLNYDKILNRTFRLPIIGRPNSMDADYPKQFKFIPPEGVQVIGGFRTATALKRTNFVDLAIEMPAECLKEKDIKNQRYHQKRALYMAQLGHLLGGSLGMKLIEKLEFKYHQGDFLKPVLLIIPQCPKVRKTTTFQLFVYPEQDSPLKLTSLKPSHGNVAPKWFFENYSFPNLDDDKLEIFMLGDSDVSPSPFYNSSILFDIEMIPNSNILFEQIGVQSNSITEALMLTKIWLYQRVLHHHFSFIMSMFVAYLQTNQIIHQNMSSYQIFKVIIKAIATSDWAGAGLSYFEDNSENIGEFKKMFPVVFLSPSGKLNLCYNITIDLYNRLKHEAEISQITLSKNCPDNFELLFLKKLDFVNKFDAIVHLPKCTRKLPVKLEYLRKFMDHGVFIPRVYSENILNLIERALTDRVTLIQQSSQHLLLDKRWNLKSIPYDPSNEDNTFTLGLLIDPEKSLRIIDIGPEAQTPEAEEFRKFWDPKCQLRLQNGVISETVVWHVENFSQRRAIIKYILTHALKKADIQTVILHYTILEKFLTLGNVYFQWRDDVVSWATEVPKNGAATKRKHDESGEGVDDDDDDDENGENVDKRQNRKPIGVGEEIFQKALNSYNQLNKLVRGIEKMKHSITSIQPMSHHLRATAVFPPLPVCLQIKDKSLKKSKGVTLFPENFEKAGKILHIEPIEILLTLDSTGKWPNDYEALEAAQADYLIQLGEQLKEQEYSVKFAENYLDVLHGQFVFRLRIKCPKELALVSSSRSKLEFQKRRMELEILPRVHAHLDQLYRERPAFGLTCRLVKRWLACQLMTDYLSDLTIELMIANLFLQPEPYTEPSSSLCGFQRFLSLVANYDWNTLPLIVNFDDQLKLDDIRKLRDSMLEDRDKFPPIVICTPCDKDISPWTKSDLTEEKFELLVRLCKKGYEFFIKSVLHKTAPVNDEIKALFMPNFKTFDLLIRLNSQVVQNFFMTIEPPKNYKLYGREPSTKQASAMKVMPIVGLNVVEEFVRLLRSKFDRVALFLYDRYGQRIIGVSLKPESEKILKGDLKSFLKDIKSMGAKMVDTITMVKHER